MDRLLVALTLCVVWTPSASADSCDGCLHFTSYYGDHMVLQKSPERAVVWGYGPDGGQVTVSLSGPVNQEMSPVTVTEGVWKVTLEPVDAGGPYTVTAASGDNAATLTDVLFGDVWLCGGQSNMQLKVYWVFNASDEVALAANYSHIRPVVVPMSLSETELTDLFLLKRPWSVPTPEIVKHSSALCWFFGRYLHDALKQPIGLVEMSVGGSHIEWWSSTRALKKCGMDQIKDRKNLYHICPMNDSAVWKSMVHPLLNMTIKGVIWHQGESNVQANRDDYNCTFPAMIEDWRMAFHQGSGGQTAADFPFGFVQLGANNINATWNALPIFRWHQTADMGFVPNPRMARTFMALSLDLPDENSPLEPVHSRHCRDMAYRLTLGARVLAYNEKDLHFTGPFPKQILCSPTHVNIPYDQEVSVTPAYSNVFEICCTVNHTTCGPNSLWVPAPITKWNLTAVELSASSCDTHGANGPAAIKRARSIAPTGCYRGPLLFLSATNETFRTVTELERGER